MVIPSADRFRSRQAAGREDRPDAFELYEQIASHIRSRFTTTTREHKLLTKEVGYGFYGFPMEIDTVYGEHRRIAGLFDMTCYYESGIYAGRLSGGSRHDESVCVYKGKSRYIASPGGASTLRKISIAADRGDEDRIADIMIGAACRDAMRGYPGEYSIPFARDLMFMSNKELMNNGYDLWHHSTKYFIFRFMSGGYGCPEDMLRECLQKGPYDAERIAELILLQFSDILDDPEVRCEVIFKNTGMMACFLYEFNATEHLMSLKREYEGGVIGKAQLMSEIDSFEKDLRGRLKKDYYAECAEDRLLSGADRRIDELVVEIRENAL